MERMTHYWFWKKWRPDRHGQPCRIVALGRRMNSALVEFEDGERVVTIRYAVRRLPESTQGCLP
jgi:hypothetical protein